MVEWKDVVNWFFAGLGAWFAYTLTPLYTGNRPELAYHYERVNDGRQCDGTWQSKLTLHICNDSKFPARDIRVLIDPLTKRTKVESPSAIDVSDAKDAYKLIRINLIPANSAVDLFVESDVEEQPDDIWAFDRCKKAPKVVDVYSEFGDATRNEQKCRAVCQLDFDGI